MRIALEKPWFCKLIGARCFQVYLLQSEHLNMLVWGSHLFACCTITTPILPFEYADKYKHGIISNDDADCKSDGDLDYVNGTTRSDPLLTKIQNMEDQCKEIFDKASKSIKKAQKHQAKGYNNRQTKCKPFEVGKTCLKRNKKRWLL